MRKIALCTLLFVIGCQQEFRTIEIISDPPGAVIEVNQDYVGKAPCTIEVRSSWEGTFKRLRTTIAAIPTKPGQWRQEKSFWGGSSVNPDPIPHRLYFNMNLGYATPQIDVNVK